jgi:hypothetical protein
MFSTVIISSIGWHEIELGHILAAISRTSSKRGTQGC